MALLVPSPEILSLAGREIPATAVLRIRIRNVRLSVCSGVKDLEKSGLKLKGDTCDDSVDVRLLHGHSRTAPFPSQKGKEEEEKKLDYYVNTGYAIRTLRKDFPELFHRELNFDIYRDDIVFKDPVNAFAGIESYKSLFWALRFHGKIFFRALWVDITSVWQPRDTMITIRWTVHGIPRIPWENHSRFDGTSEYKLDKDGKIYEHKVHNIALNGPRKFQAFAVEQLINQSVGCPSTPTPTYFKLSFSSMEVLLRHQRYLSSVLYLLRSEVESKQSA